MFISNALSRYIHKYISFTHRRTPAALPGQPFQVPLTGTVHWQWHITSKIGDPVIRDPLQRCTHNSYIDVYSIYCYMLYTSSPVVQFLCQCVFVFLILSRKGPGKCQQLHGRWCRSLSRHCPGRGPKTRKKDRFRMTRVRQ